MELFKNPKRFLQFYNHSLLILGINLMILFLWNFVLPNLVSFEDVETEATGLSLLFISFIVAGIVNLFFLTLLSHLKPKKHNLKKLPTLFIPLVLYAVAFSALFLGFCNAFSSSLLTDTIDPMLLVDLISAMPVTLLTAALFASVFANSLVMHRVCNKIFQHPKNVTDINTNNI